MKPFEELSHLGRIRRMGQLAQAALNAYGLSDVRLKFLRQAGNTLFRVNEANPTLTTKPELYTQGQYMLRIHQPGYQTAEAIELDANVLFGGGEARAIDFDDSGFGYYVYDLSLALEHCQEDKALAQFREALLAGYTQIRSLSQDQLKYLDLFLAAFWVYLSLWAAAMTHLHPQHREALLRRMERAFRLVERSIANY